MPIRFSGSMTTVAIAAAGAVNSVPIPSTQAQAPTATEQALKTPWGEPDLQGISTDETDTPLQRSAEYATQEFFTAALRAEPDATRAALFDEDKRLECGTERDVAGAYNSVFLSVKHIARAPRRLSIHPAAGFRRCRWRRRRSLPPTGNFTSPCCYRPKPARASRQPAPAGSTIRLGLRGARSLLHATTSRTSIVTTARRTTGRMTAA
jgi:hypothetical protein